MHKAIHKHIQRMHQVRRERPVTFWVRAAVVAGVASLFVFERSIWTPDTLFAIFLILFIAMGQTRAFLTRFAPFVLLLVAYDSFRSIADQLNTHVHYFEMINFDKWLFGGHLPTATLQGWWWHGTLQWYDFYFYFLYTIHFLAPIALAIVIWKIHPRLYWPYVAALAGLSFAAFVTYVLFPAAPPWMASNMHFIDPITKISTDVWHAMGVVDASKLYEQLSPNLVAAVPSLHSAYPMMFTLFIWRAFSFKRTWWIMFYPISMWIGVVYLGEHYVFDVVAGILFAVASYVVTMWAFAAIKQYRAKKKTKQPGYAYARATDENKNI